MKNSILIILISIMAMSNWACKKYLAVKSDDKLVIPHTLTDVQGILDDANIMNVRTTPSTSEAMADDYFWLTATYDARLDFEQKLYQWIPQETNYTNDWAKAYMAIYNANLSLEILDKIPVTAANQLEWNNAEGSALFYRSFYFLLLVNQYGHAYSTDKSSTDLGIVLKLSADYNEPSERATVKACYDRINNDLIKTLNYLPNHPQHVLRPSKGAALALLARSYLYMKKYTEALHYSNESIKLNSYLMDYNADESIINLTAAVPFKKYNKEIIFYTEATSFLAFQTPTRAKIDSNLYASYAANDLRKACFFKVNTGYQQYKGSYAANASQFFTGLATDELYLTRAEANAQLGNLNEAMTDLNILLKKRWKNTATYVPLTASNQVDGLMKIKLERRKELLMRNLRWMDVKRWNEDGDNIVLKRNIKGNIVQLLPHASFYALPLPTDIIRLTGMPQN